jgi:capsular polysaccharide transport system permease protein
MIHKRPAFSIFSLVVNALFLREIQTRFGTQKLGYLWAMVDPLAQIVVFSVIKMAVADGVNLGYDVPVFLATSFLAYNFFKAVVNGSMGAFDANSALFSYKQVKPFDTTVSRFLVEFLILTMATLLLIVIGLYIGFDIVVDEFNMVIFAVMWLGLLAFSWGLFFAVMASFFANFKKVVSLLMLPLFFLSGLFYTVESLPVLIQEYIVYNPIIHFIELIHGSFFKVLDTRFVNYEYMMLWTFIPLFLGLWFYTKSEEKIISS